MKKLHVVLFALGLGFLFFLIWRTGFANLWNQVTAIGWRVIPILLAEGVAEVFHAIGWRKCFQTDRNPISFGRLFQIHMAGYALNFLTPTASLAGEVTKSSMLAGKSNNATAAAVVLIGKLSFGLGHLVFVLIGLFFILPRLQLSPALLFALALSGTALATGIVIFLLLQRNGKLSSLLQWLIARRIFAKTLSKFVEPVREVDQTLKKFYQERPWDFAWSVGWHLIGYAIGIFATWYFLQATTSTVTWAVAAGIWFLSLWVDLVTFAVPMNLGVLEGGRLAAFTAFGFGAVPGMTFGLLCRAAQLLWSGVGLVNYAFLISSANLTSFSAGRSMPKISQPVPK